MKEQRKIDLGLTGIDDLFMSHQERADKYLPKIQQKDISLIDSFEGHPFKVQKDDDMVQLMESIREYGVITPIILRPKEAGRFELISGHRRVFACKELGIETIPAEVRDMSRDEAIIYMVDSNLQRSTILPSEKAFSYKMRLDAMKRQGQRTDLTSSPLETKLRSSEIIAQATGDSRAQVDRYIRLTKLIPEMLSLVDAGQIALRPAVELSYLQPEEQEDLYMIIQDKMATPSYTQAIQLHQHSQKGELSNDMMVSIMDEKKPNQKEKFTLKAETVKKYLPKGLTDKQAEDYIIRALSHYNRTLNRDKDMER